MTNVRIVDWRRGALTVSAIREVRDATDMNLTDAKLAIEAVLGRQVVELTVRDVDGFLERMSEFGFQAERAE